MPSDDTRCEIFDQYINLGNEIANDRMPLGGFHIDAQALLAAVLLDEITAAAVAKIRQMARTIATGWQLDFDYFGSHLSH